MNKNYSYFNYFIGLFLLSIIMPGIGFSQNRSLNSVVTAIKAEDRNLPDEKIFVHTDRSWYKAGDTIWYKAYVLNAHLAASTKSGLMYVELINDSNRVVKRLDIKINNGIANGNIAVKRKMYPGNYTLRAYTNWVRNFGIGHFFSCQIKIAASGDDFWLVNEQHIVDKNNNVNLSFHFSDITLKNIGFRDIQVSVMGEDNELYKKKLLTDPYGNLPVKFKLPKKKDYKYVSLIAEDISKYGDGRKIIIPVKLNRPEDIDLQFMPEGGDLLAGSITKVGFKAINEDGKGVLKVQGQIVDHNMKEVAVFQSAHNGMGAFTFSPQPSEKYIARVAFPDGSIKNFSLPDVKNSGVAIQVKNMPDSDNVQVNIVATPDIMNGIHYYDLVAVERDSVYYVERFGFNRKTITKNIAKRVFASGLVKFILVDVGSDQPIAQRLAFIDNGDQLNFFVNTNKKNYSAKDSAAFHIYVTNAVGKPVKGSFSLAVTDDNEVKPDNNRDNIQARMLLSSDLKGYIEEPGYYFNKENVDRAEALDNLLLTQGWAVYNLKPYNKPGYVAETKFKIRGTATNIFNGIISDAEISLISDFPPIKLTANTDKDGNFAFNDVPDLEKMDFKLQTTRDFNVGIVVEQFSPPAIGVASRPVIPWFVNCDSTLVNYTTDNSRKAQVNNAALNAMSADEAFARGRKLLKEVVIRNNRFRAPPVVRLQMDEEDLRNVRTNDKPLTIMDLLNQKEKINHMFKFLIVDEQAYMPWGEMASTDKQWQINKWLSFYNTDDIKDLRVEKMFFNTKLGETPAICIYITSNAQNGPSMASAGVYSYHPMPITAPDKFYSPKYNNKDERTVADKRTTIYWAPNIETDASGNATVSFYTADLPGTYSFTIQGSDMNGNVGYKRGELRIVK